MKKLHPHLLLALLATLPCFASCISSSVDMSQDFADYHNIENPLPDSEELPPPEMIDFDLIDQEFVLETKKIEIPGHPFAFNPSVLRWNGRLLMSFRTYDPHTNSTSPFGIVWLDEDFNPIGEPQLFELPFHNPVLPSKQQDPRLINVGSRLYVLYNNLLEHVTHREMRRMYVVELDHDGSQFIPHEPECLIHFEGENEMRYEKNWVPFEYKNQLHLGYSISPHMIFRPHFGTNCCETLHATDQRFPWSWGVPRGGTQAIRDADQYIAFFHSWIDVPTVQSNGKKITHYVMGAYTFDAHPPFALRSVSPEPIIAKNFYQPPYYKTWKPLRCVFPAGLVIAKEAIWVSYGRQDHECWVIKLDKKKLLKSLVPVACQK